MTTLSVFLPAYNEANNVRKAVEDVNAVLQRFDLDYEIIVVNDGSKDNTGDIVREVMQDIPELRLEEHFPNRGYGGALKAGFAAAQGELIAFAPSDNQFDFGEITHLLEKIQDADIVSGYRVDRQDTFMRKVNAFGWNMLVRLLFGYLCRDIDCGFKLFRREVIERVPVTSEGAMIDTELLARAKAYGYRIAEVPVTHLPRTAGAATGANIRVILRAFRDLVRFRRQLTQEIQLRKLASSSRT
jgi:glycosyltransferase involved in cell wall biosynthesis